MHWTTFTRTQRTRRTSAGNLRTRALKNWLSRHRTPGRGTHRPRRGACLCNRRDRTRRRSFVDGTRSGLRNNHAWRWGLRRTRRWRRRTCRDRSLRRGRACHRRPRRHRSLNRGRCRRSCRSYRHSDGRGSRSDCRGRTRSRPLRRRGDYFRSSRWRCNYGCGSRRCKGRRSCFHCRRQGHWLGRDRRCSWPSRSCYRFLLLRNSFQHIAGPRDVRQIDLSLDFFFTAQLARGTGRRRLCFGRAADVGPYFFRFMLLERTGMGLLLRHPDDR